jgi:hypothetical protein
MTNNVIGVDFGKFKDGYIKDLETDQIVGVTVKDLVAETLTDDKTVNVGFKQGDTILAPSNLSIEEMNRFCIMWLGIFNPDVIKCDEE